MWLCSAVSFLGLFLAVGFLVAVSLLWGGCGVEGVSGGVGGVALLLSLSNFVPPLPLPPTRIITGQPPLSLCYVCHCPLYSVQNGLHVFIRCSALICIPLGWRKTINRICFRCVVHG